MKAIFVAIMIASLVTNGVQYFGDFSGEAEGFPAEQCVVNERADIIFCVKSLSNNLTANLEIQEQINQSKELIE